jgi:prevent-host-death family protein
MAEIGAFEAKTHFSALLKRAEKGEEIVITRRGKPVAKLVPATPKHDPKSAWAALERMQAAVRKAKLGPISAKEIKELINEGRKY